MDMLPTVKLGGHSVTRLICGGNTFSGFSHVSAELDWEMVRYYTMPRIQKVLSDCWANGINTLQSRADRHMMRAVLEHRENGGQLQWIAQTASELADHKAHIRDIARYGPIAIYLHGTYNDNCWHSGQFEQVHDRLRWIKETGLLAGIGSHIPEVIEYCEEHGWEADFYMCCLYNLARGYKNAPATAQNAYAQDQFPAEDPPRMVQTIRQVKKPCIAFKLMAASRNCTTSDSTQAAFEFALRNIKPTDMVDVGMFPKYRDQVKENADFVRQILARNQ